MEGLSTLEKLKQSFWKSNGGCELTMETCMMKGGHSLGKSIL